MHSTVCREWTVSYFLVRSVSTGPPTSTRQAVATKYLYTVRTYAVHAIPYAYPSDRIDVGARSATDCHVQTWLHVQSHA